MDHEEIGRYWDGNAEVWTELVRAGYDHYRDGLNSPAFFEMLPDVEVCPVSMSATTSGDGRERSMCGSSPPVRRKSARFYRLSALLFSCAPWAHG
jgi:hypothetical protein